MTAHTSVYCPLITIDYHKDVKVYTKFILRGWPQRQQETLYSYTRGLLHG